jgi:uncharacterized protein YjbI with pentapeptide repeats
MKYTIKRVDGGEICAVKIDCADGASEGIKLGLAVKVALKNGAFLSSANLVGADLPFADLSFADLSSADLSFADLYRANLSVAELSGADLSSALLSRADLSRADLSFANLSGAKLRGADLYRANLSRANLSDANQYGADLSGAKLSVADLSRAKIGDHVIEKLVARATRSDGYEFLGFKTDKGTLIRAGCRTMTVDEYRDHVAKEYPDTDKARETLEILKSIEVAA